MNMATLSRQWFNEHSFIRENRILRIKRGIPCKTNMFLYSLHHLVIFSLLSIFYNKHTH